MKTTVVKFDKQFAKIICEIRQNVFTVEQKIDADLDLDGKDDDAKHALIKDDNIFIGTARLQKNGHIGRLAVIKKYRNNGLGTALINQLIDVAITDGLKRVYLGAQIQTVRFYQKMGFNCYGDTFDEVGIEHIYMEKTLVTWPAVLQYQGDDELVYLDSFADFYENVNDLFQSFHSGDQLIDSVGATYTLNKAGKSQISPILKNQYTTLIEFEALLKKHMSFLNQCCISKIHLTHFHEGFDLIKRLHFSLT